MTIMNWHFVDLGGIMQRFFLVLIFILCGEGHAANTVGKQGPLSSTQLESFDNLNNRQRRFAIQHLLSTPVGATLSRNIFSRRGELFEAVAIGDVEPSTKRLVQYNFFPDSHGQKEIRINGQILAVNAKYLSFALAIGMVQKWIDDKRIQIGANPMPEFFEQHVCGFLYAIKHWEELGAQPKDDLNSGFAPIAESLNASAEYWSHLSYQQLQTKLFSRFFLVTGSNWTAKKIIDSPEFSPQQKQLAQWVTQSCYGAL